MRNLDRLPAGEALQDVGQIHRLGHRRAVDENGNDRDFPLECRRDLDADEIVGIIEATPVLIVDTRSPMLADDGNERVAFSHALGQDVNEIAARWNGVDIEEDVVTAKAAGEPIGDPPGVTAGSLPVDS